MISQEKIYNNKSLFVIIFLIILIAFIIKPIRIMNYSNVDKIIITNEAKSSQPLLTLNNNEIIKLKDALGKVSLMTFALDIDKVIFNIRVDLYKGDKIKYTMYFYSNNGINSEKPVVALAPQHYKMNPNVALVLNKILQDNNFSLESY